MTCQRPGAPIRTVEEHGMDGGDDSATEEGPEQPVETGEGGQRHRPSIDLDPSDVPWIGLHLARALVAMAAGFDDKGATDWLTSISRPPHPWLRSRFSPPRLAERGLDQDYPTEEALARGRDPASGLGLEDVEWREDELGVLLARRFDGRQWWGTEGAADAGDGPPPWITFALARGEVARALRYPEDAAAEWLRKAAGAGRVRVRYAARHQLRQQANLRLNGHPSNLTHEERAAEHLCWFTPVHDMKFGPIAMHNQPMVSCSEWDADTLSAALAAETATPPLTAADGLVEVNAKEGGTGRPPAWPWPEIVAEAAVRFTLAGSMKLEALYADLQRIAEAKNNRKPGRSTVKPYAKLILDAWERHAANGGK